MKLVFSPRQIVIECK